MKVSEMIKNLQDFMDRYGDLDCWYAVDDEGNGYQKVHYSPSTYLLDTSSDYVQDGFDSLEEAEDCNACLDDLNMVCIVN